MTDPSGRYPFPTHCQAMGSKAVYESCVLNYYKLEPIDQNNMGATVEGGQGCYKGPNAYRAPGYLEGIGGTTTIFFGAGIESVYDFATMERAGFTYTAQGLTDIFLGGSVFVYAGRVDGLKVDFANPTTNLITDYSGLGNSWSVGGSIGPVLIPLPEFPALSIGIGVGAGYSHFSSNSDPMIRGGSVYVGGALALEVPYLDFSEFQTTYSSFSQDSYLLPGGVVNRGKLYSDIRLGHGSPILGGGLIPFALRNYWAVQADKYANAYEEIRFQEILGW